ncbi:hypothetical protein [Treponema sp.]|uniref:hypothetical protein n=1 Tax=Treponema sp. TaxID=166 RepID=UPI00388FA103
MDNANEVNSVLTHKEVSLFLGDELKNQKKEEVITYDLVKEYEKTQKNRKPLVWVLFAVCFFGVAAGTFTTIGLVSRSNHKIAINIDSFDDLNLRSLLNSVGRTQNLYEDALKTKTTLEQNLQDELNQAEQKRESDLFTLQSVATVSSKEAIARKKTLIETEYSQTVQSLNNSYAVKIAGAEENIKKYRLQVESYDSAQLSVAKEAESSIDSTKQLHDIEMKNQSERYERKIKELRLQLIEQQRKAAEEQRKAVEEVRSIYQAKIDLLDPKAREQSHEQDKIIDDTGIKNKTAASALWSSVEKLEFDESSYLAKSSNPSELFSNSLRKTQRALLELRTIAFRFKPIPMENSIKDYVPAMIHQSYQVADELAETAAKLQGDLTAFEFLAEQSLLGGNDGLILNTASAPEYSVYIAEISRAKLTENTFVQIISNGRQAAEGVLTKKGGSYILTVITNEQSAVYQPVTGDKIRIVTKTES